MTPGSLCSSSLFHARKSHLQRLLLPLNLYCCKGQRGYKHIYTTPTVEGVLRDKGNRVSLKPYLETPSAPSKNKEHTPRPPPKKKVSRKPHKPGEQEHFHKNTSIRCRVTILPPPQPFCFVFQLSTCLSSVPIKYPEDGGVSLVHQVSDYFEPVLHVIPPALDGVDSHVVALELPGLGELSVQHV